MQRPEILARLRERITAFAASRYMGGSAEDLAQDVLLVLHEKYAGVESLEELLPLGLKILRYKIMGQQAKTWRRGEHKQTPVEDMPLPDPGDDPEEMAAKKERLGRLKHALGEMGERCREVFRHKLEGKGFPEIQKIMGAASVNTVYTWDSRCRKELLEKLGGSWR